MSTPRGTPGDEKFAFVGGGFDPEAVRRRLAAALVWREPATYEWTPLVAALGDIPALLAEIERLEAEVAVWKGYANNRGDGSRNG